MRSENTIMTSHVSTFSAILDSPSWMSRLFQIGRSSSKTEWKESGKCKDRKMYVYKISNWKYPQNLCKNTLWKRDKTKYPLTIVRKITKIDHCCLNGVFIFKERIEITVATLSFLPSPLPPLLRPNKINGKVACWSLGKFSVL